MKGYLPSSPSTNSYNYKPFIKNISFQQVSTDRLKSNQTNNKTFFSNIKAQLNSIRTDVNKLVTKDPPRTIGSANKSFNVSSAQKSDTGNDYMYDRTIDKKGLNESRDKINYSNIGIQNKVAELTIKLSQQTIKNEQISQQFQQQRKNQQYLRDQINNLRDNLVRANQQLNIKNKQIENCKFIYQKTLQQKQQYVNIVSRLQIELKKTSNRVQKVIQQDPQLQKKLKQKQVTINKLLYDLQKSKQQNRNLVNRMETFQKDKQIQIAVISKTYEQRLNRQEAKSFKELGGNFQLKINQLLNQNYKLKNKIVFLESQIEKQRVQIQSLKSTVQAYESRDLQLGQSTNQLQLQKLRNKVMQLQQQNDKLQSDHQYEIMKLQNTIDELKQKGKNINDNKSFNQILKDQINQIQNLKQKLRQKNEIINRIKK